MWCAIVNKVNEPSGSIKGMEMWPNKFS